MQVWVVTAVLHAPGSGIINDGDVPIIGVYASHKSALTAAKDAFESSCVLDDEDPDDTFESYLQPSEYENVSCYVMDNEADFRYVCTITEITVEP
jgi:hypothetical protein